MDTASFSVASYLAACSASILSAAARASSLAADTATKESWSWVLRSVIRICAIGVKIW